MGRFNLRRPVAVIAFSGWNDAGEAASAVVEHLCERYHCERFAALDPEKYYDFQVSRPCALRDEDGARRIEWPTTQASTLALPGRDLVVIAGPEPNYRWRKFIGKVVDMVAAAEPELVVLLGAMLSDAPHTRPIPVTATTENPQLAQELELTGSDYEGPTGIVGALAAELEPAGWPTVTVWASVPHYVSEPPNPKATLALLTKLEEILGTPLDSADLFAQAEAWSEQVSELVEENPEIGEYISALEERRDKDTPPPTADSIAAEFERYLRRRDARS